MPEEAEHKVVYRAVGDVSQAIAQFRALREELRKLKNERGGLAGGAEESKAVEQVATVRRKAATEQNRIEQDTLKTKKKIASEEDEAAKKWQRVVRQVEQDRQRAFMRTSSIMRTAYDAISSGETKAAADAAKLRRAESEKAAKERIAQERRAQVEIERIQREAQRAEARILKQAESERQRSFMRSASIMRTAYDSISLGEARAVKASARERQAEESRAAKARVREEKEAQQEAKRSHQAAQREIQRISKRSFTEIAKDAVMAWRSVGDGESVIKRVSTAFRSMDNSRGSGSGSIFSTMTAGLSGIANASSKALSSIGFWPVVWGSILAIIGPAITIFAALGGAMLGAANAAVSLASASAALPGIIAAVGTAAAALTVALGPVGEAFKAFKSHQDNLDEGSSASSRVAAQNANRLRDAARSVQRAERGIADAQYEAARAADRLNKTRRDELRNLQDLRAEVARSSLNEERATLALQQAQDEYNRSLADPKSSLLDQRDAALRLREAEWDLYDVRVRNKRNANDLTEAERKGVEGSDAVIDARRAVDQANQRVADSTLDLADAQFSLADAQREIAAGGTTAVNSQAKLEAAMAKLSPSTRQFVEGIFAMKPAWDEIGKSAQESFFNKITPQLGMVKSLLPTVKTLFDDAAGAMGRVSARGVEMVSSGPWRADFEKLSKSNVVNLENMGDAGLAIADAFRSITLAAIPFTQWVTGAIKRASESFAAWSDRARRDGSIESFLGRTSQKMSITWQILKNLGSAFASTFKATDDFTIYLLQRTEAMTGRWRRAMVEQTKDGSKFKQWLEDIKPLLTEIATTVGAVAGGIASIAGDTGNIDSATKSIQKLREEVGGPLRRLIESMGKEGVTEGLIGALGKFLDSLAKFVEGGGGQGIVTFLNVLTGALDALTAVLTIPGVKEALVGLSIGLGALAAASLVGKFTGIFKLIDGLKWLVNNKGNLKGAGLDKLLGRGDYADGGKATAAETSAARGLTAAATELSAAAAALQRAAVSLGAGGVGGTATGKPGKAATGAAGAGAAAGAGKVAAGSADDVAKSSGKLSKLRMTGGPAAFIASILAMIGGEQLMSSGKPVAGGTLAGAGLGFSIGGPMGAAYGTAIGHGVGQLGKMKDLYDRLGKGEDDKVVEEARKNAILSIFPPAVIIAEFSKPFEKWFTETVPEFFGRGWDHITKTVSDWFTEVLPDIILGPFQGIWSSILDTFKENFGADVEWWFTETLPGFIKGQFSGTWSFIWDLFTVNFVPNMTQWFTRDLPGIVFGPFRGAWSEVFKLFKEYVVTPVGDFFGGIGSSIKERFTGGISDLFGLGRAGGGWVRGAPGTDNIRLNATDGEFVVNKLRANQGTMPILLEAINTGRLSSDDLLAGLAGAVGAGAPQFAAGRAASVSNVSNTSVTNGGVRIDKLEINNPRQERAGDSLYRRIQGFTSRR